jgi:uncharacterized protein YecA (UPF0149 family)
MNKEDPSWRTFTDSWVFYSEDAIAQRYTEEVRDDEFVGSVHTFVRAVPKIGRNDTCPCCSGKKYKRCCLQ